MDLDLDLEYDRCLLPPPLLSSATGRDLSSGDLDLDLDRDLDTDLEYDLSLLVVVSVLLSPPLSLPSRSPPRSLAGGGDLDLSLPPRSLLGGGPSQSLLAFPLPASPSSTGPGPAICCFALSSCRLQCPPSS